MVIASRCVGKRLPQRPTTRSLRASRADDGPYLIRSPLKWLLTTMAAAGCSWWQLRSEQHASCDGAAVLRLTGRRSALAEERSAEPHLADAAQRSQPLTQLLTAIGIEIVAEEDHEPSTALTDVGRAGSDA